MGEDILGLDLDDVGDADIGESDGVGLGIRDLFVDLFGGEEIELLELFDWTRLLHHINIINQIHSQ